MPCEFVEMITCHYILQADCVVKTSTCEYLSIRTKGHAIDTLRPLPDREDRPPCSHIPQVDSFVNTPTCQHLSIRTKGYGFGIRTDPLRIPFKRLENIPIWTSHRRTVLSSLPLASL